MASDVPALAQATVDGLHQLGLPDAAMAWEAAGEVHFHPPEPATPDMRRELLAAFADKATKPSVHWLNAHAEGMRAACTGLSTVALNPVQARLLRLTGHRLAELSATSQLQGSLRNLEHAERLQRALFAIADMAASELDMQSLLQGLHKIVGGLMYAENFYIALYDNQRQVLRFVYFVDTLDGVLFGPEQELPVAQMSGSITLALIRHARAVRGPSAEVAIELGLKQKRGVGTPSLDFMGIPMRRDGLVHGALVVQSYKQGHGYTQSDQDVLAFVAEHVLNALERKLGQQALEQRVAQRTQELGAANALLQEQVHERERAAHLQAMLYRIAALASGQLSDEAFYRSIHEAVGDLITAENFYIALLSFDGSRLDFPYGVDVSGDTFHSRTPGRGMTEYTMRQGQTVLADRQTMLALAAQGALDFAHAGSPSMGWLGAPLLGPAGVMGVVAVQSYRADLSYSAQDADLLTYVSYQIANSVQRRRQAEALQQLNAELEQRVHVRTQELREQIVAREEVQQQLKHQVMHDALTGLPNRVYLRDRLERMLECLRRKPERGFALFYLDVDRFKLFNDSLGHQAGDAVLREVAARLLRSVRPPDVVARLSGDEFSILLDESDPAAATRVAQRIQDQMQAPLQLGGHALHVSISIGIAMAHPDHETIDDLLHDADTALYRAKAGGRQRAVLFDQSLESSDTNVLDMEQQMRRALQAGEFTPHFQPIVQLADAQVVGYEALIRWQHPARGLLGPGEFLPAAERTGLMEALDWQMYRIACTQGKRLLQGTQVLNINISPRHFQNEHFDRQLLALLDEIGFDPRHLCIEVTEGSLLHRPENVARTLESLQEAGMRIALDDFGTGYSSLSHVHSFPLKSLKIDRSFIRTLGAEDGKRSSAIIGAVLNLAAALGVSVVAEGVETETQRQALLAMGCVFAQGYYFGRPAAAEHWMDLPAYRKAS